MSTKMNSRTLRWPSLRRRCWPPARSDAFRPSPLRLRRLCRLGHPVQPPSFGPTRLRPVAAPALPQVDDPFGGASPPGLDDLFADPDVAPLEEENAEPMEGDAELFEIDPDDIPPGVDPEEFLEVLRQRLAAQAGAGGRSPSEQPLTEDQKRAAALLAQYVQVTQLPRSPGRILNTLAERREPKSGTMPPPGEQPPPGETQPPPPQPQPPQPQQFFQQVVVGDWAAVKGHLAALPEDVASKVFSHLLALLSQADQTPLLPDDILALADAAPAELDPSQLAVLGRILAASLGQVDRPRAMLARIAEGTQRLGGSDPQKRLAAARLLIAAGMTEAAGPYLPDLTKVLQEQDAVLINLHASYLLALDRRKPDAGARLKAWELSQTILGLPDADQKQRADALRRSLSLLPRMPGETADEWLRVAFAERPALGLRVLAAVVQQVESALVQRDPAAREQALQSQRRVAGQLLKYAAQDDPTRSIAVELITLGWLKEAQFAIAMAELRARQPEPDPEDPLALAMAELRARQPGPADEDPRWTGIAQLIELAGKGEMEPLPAERLLPLCPDESWCGAVDGDMAGQIRRLNGRLAALAADRDRTFAAVRNFVESDPEFTRSLLQGFVRNWSQRLSGVREEAVEQRWLSGPRVSWISGPRASFGPSFMPQPYDQSSTGGIPLTRARQVRNLEEYADLLREMRQLGAPPLDENVLVAAFAACHSPAEVYREEDIQQAFGPLDKLRPAVARSLASTIRQQLAQQWRQPDVQEQMNTRRTDKEQVAEVRRGYELAVRLAAAAAEVPGERLAAGVVLASTYFDQAEFEYGQKAELAIYANLRDRAFATYRQAAESYAGSLPDRGPDDRSVEVYQRWFQSSLGASDLAYLTRQDRPDRDQVDQIAAALAALGGKETDRHLKLFGESVTSTMSSVPPQLKPHYLREALRVLGDHDSGQAARQRLQYYDELLHEVQLHLAVDGRAEVGHGRPFGVQLAIRNTEALGAKAADSRNCCRRRSRSRRGRKSITKKRSQRRCARSWPSPSKSTWSASTTRTCSPGAMAGAGGRKRRWPTWCCGARTRRSIACRWFTSIWSSTTETARSCCR